MIRTTNKELPKKTKQRYVCVHPIRKLVYTNPKIVKVSSSCVRVYKSVKKKSLFKTATKYLFCKIHSCTHTGKAYKRCRYLTSYDVLSKYFITVHLCV